MVSTHQRLKTRYVHYVWDDDEDESFCGLDVSDKQWAVVLQVDCPQCIEIERFVRIFNAFNTTYDVRDSIKATLQLLRSESNE